MRVTVLGAYHVSFMIYVFNKATPLTLSTMEQQIQLKTGYNPACKKEMGDNWSLFVSILAFSNPHQCDPRPIHLKNTCIF